jgi:hypothetical protein
MASAAAVTEVLWWSYFLHLFLLKESSMHVNGEGGEYLLIEISCREIGWFVRCGVAEAGDCCLRRTDDLP